MSVKDDCPPETTTVYVPAATVVVTLLTLAPVRVAMSAPLPSRISSVKDDALVKLKAASNEPAPDCSRYERLVTFLFSESL